MLNDLKQLSSSQIKTLIGVCLIKVATGSIGCWGSINLYILSYLYHRGAQISPQTNSLIILCTIIPMSIIVLVATKLSDKFGYQCIIRVCAIIFTVSPMLIYFTFNFVFLTIFCVFFPISAFSISSIAVINCLWTQFPKSKNKATSIAVVFFGIGTAFWNYLFTLKANPNNEPALIISQSSQIAFFSQNVSSKAFFYLKIGYILCGSLFMIGSLLVKKNIEYEDSVLDSSKSGEYQLKALSFQDSLLQNYHKENDKYSKKNIKTLKQALLNTRFILVFAISFLTGLYQIFLNMNLKIIFLPILNDDRFLVYCAISGTAISILGAFIWGYLGDKNGFFNTLLIFAILDTTVKIYGDFADTRATIFILFILIGLTDKGMLTIMGPGLVKMFGIQLATELLPYKGFSVFLGYLFAPLGYICLSKFINPFQYLIVLSIFNIPSIICAYKLNQIKGSKSN